MELHAGGAREIARAVHASTQPTFARALADTPRPRCRTRSARRRPPRIHIQYPQPVVDAGRYPAKRTVGDLVEVSCDVFRDGHEKLRAVVRVPPRRARAEWARGRAARRSTRTINGVRWGGSFVVDAHGPLGVDDRGLDRRLRHLARRAAAQARGRPARPRGRAERGRRAARATPPARAEGPDRKLIEHALRVLDDDEILEARQARRRARARALRRDRAQRRAPRR